MTAIELNNLTITYAKRIIIKQFNAIINQGEFIGIFGPNGSGKSTLLRTILGLIKPAQGEVRIFNHLQNHGHKNIGYMPQIRTPVNAGRLSGRARLIACYQGTRWGLPLVSKKQLQEIDSIIHRVHAEAFADRPFAELSGGERQRLLLAQALLGNPKILLLDEPLNNLDPQHQESLVELINRIRVENQVTVLFASHDLNPLLHVMDRIIYLAHGNAAMGKVAEIITTQKLSWLYGTPMEVIQHNHRLFVINQDSGVTEHDSHD